MSKLRRQSIVAFRLAIALALVIECAAPTQSHAYSYAEADAGGTIHLPMSGADHFKIGLRFSALWVAMPDWTPWLTLDTGLAAFGVVNEGAAATATQPRLEETTSASQPLLARALVRTPWRFARGFRFVTGLTWYYADFNYPASGSVPLAPTAGFYWQKINKKWTTELYTGLSLNPFGHGSLLLVPEIAMRGKLLGEHGVRAALKIPVFRSFEGGVVGVQPSFSVSLVLGH